MAITGETDVAVGLRKPRIFVTDMVGGHVQGDKWRSGAAWGVEARLIEYPPIAELQAMSTEHLQALCFTSIEWSADPGGGGGLDVLKFWRNDGKKSDFLVQGQAQGYCCQELGEHESCRILPKTFNKSDIQGEVRGVKVFYTQRNVIGLALLGGGGQVLAQEGPAMDGPDDGYGERVFTFAANEKLVGFQCFCSLTTQKLGCIVADMGTTQEGGALDPALVPVYAPPIFIYANVEPDPCFGGLPEVWRFSEAAKPHSLPSGLRAHLTTDEYTAVMEGVNAVLDRHGAPQEGCCKGPLCQTCFTDGIDRGLLRMAATFFLVPLLCWDLDQEARGKQIQQEVKAALEPLEAKGLQATFQVGKLRSGGGSNGSHTGPSSGGDPSGIAISVPTSNVSNVPQAPQPMVMTNTVSGVSKYSDGGGLEAGGTLTKCHIKHALTWKEARAQADREAGGLPTCDELRKAGVSAVDIFGDGVDLWMPVRRSDGRTGDYCQIGNHEVNKTRYISHIDTYGMPRWGKNTRAALWRPGPNSTSCCKGFFYAMGNGAAASPTASGGTE